MSDNVSQMHTPQGKKLVRRILLFSLILLLVLGGCALYFFRDSINTDAMRRYFKYLNVTETSHTGHFSFDAHSGNRYAGLGDGLALASVSGVTVLDANGAEQASLQMQMSLPELRVGKDAALCFDAGGTSLCTVSRRKGAILQVTSERAILDADISPDDCVCYSTSESGYRSVLYVYNAAGTKTYRWLSSSRYLPVCTVSTGAKYLAAAALGQQEGMFQSSVVLFDTTQDKPLRELPLGDELIFDLEFLSDDTLLAIGETTASWLKLDGTVLGRYSYADAYLKDFDDGGSGFLTLCLNMYKAGSRYSVVTLGADGTERGSLFIGEEILDFSAAGKYIAVLTASDLRIYDETLTLYASTDNVAAATDVIQRADGSAILISGGSGSLFIP